MIIPHQNHSFTSGWQVAAWVTLILTWAFGKPPAGGSVLLRSPPCPRGPFQPAVPHSLVSPDHRDRLWAVDEHMGAADPPTLNRALRLFMY